MAEARAAGASGRLQSKLCSATAAAALIQDGQTVASAGFVGAAHPEALTAALEARFLESGSPRNLRLVYGAGQGDGRSRGLNHLAHAGLLRSVIGGHWGLAPALGRLALEEKIEGYNLPQGVICQLFRDIAAGRPGLVTHVGLGTFVDPAIAGPALNSSSREQLVERVELGGKTWLWYKAFPIHVALIRATSADIQGNLSMQEEALKGEVLALAQAAHNAGGLVLAQVSRLSDRSIAPHQAAVPGVLVSRIVVADPQEHWITFGEPRNPAYWSSRPEGASAWHPGPIEDPGRAIIAARACDELKPGDLANLGIGTPEGVARIAAGRGLLDSICLTVESGPLGGIPAGGLSFGAASYPEAIIDQPAQFDFYDGGGLDFAALGLAQVDAAGNVNVSKFGRKFAGVGGFVNISQNARRVVFCGTFMAGDLRVQVNNGTLRILQEGSVRKFVPRVEQLCFNALRGIERGQEILYVTERAVFRATSGGLELIEVVSGIDIKDDILPHMGFAPIVRNPAVVPPKSC